MIDSWNGAFSYIAEDPEKGIKGLRTPQIGAVHIIHGHWTVSKEIGTIVMPTGTGKTETMLSVLVSRPCAKVLVVVPTDALRTQLANKFLTLGILKDPESRVLSENALYPVVGILHHKPRDFDEVDTFFGGCHVIVTTSHIAGQCTDQIQERIARHCPFLFIDEAHHAEAPTWRSFKEKFDSHYILQFTATPFREDGKHLDGKIIYKYPLKKAQEEGYFKSIRFEPVIAFNPAESDLKIAEKAVEQLRRDRKYNHILMARVESVERAREVFPLYQKYKEFNPVQLHTGIKSISEREEIRRKILSGESKIVVCVDMLGEGFDLPELKIAAFHDIRKSLAVTLQLAGRFTRARSDLGEPTFIANVAEVDVQDELRKLYTRDPDWNYLLPELSESVIDAQVSLKEFLDGFASFPEDIPLKRMRPATSTVIYKTKCADWTPENFKQGIPGSSSLERIHWDVNYAKKALVVVTAKRVRLDWADIEEIYNWDWELYVVIWDDAQHFQKDVVTVCEMKSAQLHPRQPRGTFRCECGFAYSRVGPDQTKADRYTLDHYVSFGEQWDHTLREGLGIGEPYDVIKKRLGVSLKTMYKQMFRLGLKTARGKSPRPRSTSARKSLDGRRMSAKILEQRRVTKSRKLLELRKANPELSRSQLHAEDTNLYSWLFRNDRPWLEKQLPGLQPGHGRITPSVWSERDAVLAAAVPVEAERIRGLPGRPMMISATCLAHNLEIAHVCSKRAHVLPLTYKALQETAETQDQYAVRRVEWATSSFAAKGLSPLAWRIALLAGLNGRSAKKPVVKTALDKAVALLKAQMELGTAEPNAA